MPNVTATYTICRDNVTCNGENPEFSAYYNMVYKKEFPTDPPVDPFDIATVSKWLDYNKPTQGLNYNTD